MMDRTTRRQFMRIGACFTAGTMAMQIRRVWGLELLKRPNVVFIAIEDFSPQRLGSYGGPVKSPNIDRLASEGLLFENAYCMSPVCNASRTALFTGLRPDTTGVFSNSQDWRKMLGDIVTMPMHFGRNGYDTIRIGKMYHGKWEHDESWTRVIPSVYDSKSARPKKAALRPTSPVKDRGGVPLLWGPTGNSPEDDRDGQLTEQAVRFLGQKHDKPFFLGIGLHAPHLAFRAPDVFHKMYDPDHIKLPQNPENDLEDMPIKQKSADQRSVTRQEWKEVIAAHYATISYADWCVGRVLNAIEELGKENETVVVVWSDHGFMLGEHFQWRKGSLYEESARVAFIWRVPGVTPKGARCRRPVETIDVFPTLFDLCNIPQPKTVEGISMKPLLQNPSITWKKGAITWKAGNGDMVAIQTERYRFNKRPSDGFIELYDHMKDPREFTNVAKDPAYRETVTKLSVILQRGWQACIPEIP
jgi:arylsulfatase A-like enzyme